MAPLADRSIELQLRGRVRFGVGAIEALPELVARCWTVGAPSSSPTRAWSVRASWIGRAGSSRQLGSRSACSRTSSRTPARRPSSGAARRWSRSARPARSSCRSAAGRRWTRPRSSRSTPSTAATSWRSATTATDLEPGRPLVAVPTTAGTGAETNTYGVITDEAAGRKEYVGHPSLLPAWTILDPALTVGLPPAATAATGIDALTHAIESLLSANPNPFAEALALGSSGRSAPGCRARSPTARDLEARSQMLMASHLAGVGQASGTGVGLVHALGHAIGSRGRLPHGTALAAVLPEVLAFYAAEPGLRDHELALIGESLRRRLAGRGRRHWGRGRHRRAADASRHAWTAAQPALPRVRRRRPSTSWRPMPSPTPPSATPLGFRPWSRPGPSSARSSTDLLTRQPSRSRAFR